MNKYEAMFIIKPDLSEEDKQGVFTQIGDIIAKNSGSVTQAQIWAERRKLAFPIKKYYEGLYYLLNFDAPTDSITQIKYLYKVNEDILRVLITAVESK